MVAKATAERDLHQAIHAATEALQAHASDPLVCNYPLWATANKLARITVGAAAPVLLHATQITAPKENPMPDLQVVDPVRKEALFRALEACHINGAADATKIVADAKLFESYLAGRREVADA